MPPAAPWLGEPASPPNDRGAPATVPDTSLAPDLSLADPLPAPPMGPALAEATRAGHSHASPTLAIDIGGRWAKIGLVDAGELSLVSAGGQPLVPALVAARDDGSIAAGQEARTIAAEDPTRAVSVRDVLRALDDPDLRIDRAPPAVKMIDEEVFLDLKTATVTFSNALFHFLALLRSGIVQHLGHDQFKVVVTVPFDVSSEGRRYLRAGCVEAKLDVARFVTEPEALAHAVGLDERPIENALLIDAGATHLALNVLQRQEGQLGIVAHRWLTAPSGHAFDEQVAQMTLEELARQIGTDYRSDASIRRRLVEASERARADIRRSSTVDLRVLLPAPDTGALVEQTIRLARAQIYTEVEPLVAEICRHAQEILREAGIDPRFIGAVVMAGSCGAFPPLIEGFQSLTLQEPLTTAVPTQAYLAGGTRLAAQIARKARAQRPDTLRAAIGIELPGGRFKALAPTGAGLPLRLRRRYPTTRDNQTDLELKFYQGEGELVRSNTFVGAVALHGLPVGLRGELTIDLDLYVDKEGVLTVSLSEPKSDALNTMRVPTQQTTTAKRESLQALPPPPRAIRRRRNNVKKVSCPDSSGASEARRAREAPQTSYGRRASRMSPPAASASISSAGDTPLSACSTSGTTHSAQSGADVARRS